MKAGKFCMAALVLLAVLALGGCATTEVEYESNFWGLDDRGEINILLSRSVPKLTVLIDDRIVLDGRGWNTRRVDVRNVPDGPHHVKMFADSWQLQENFYYEETVELGRGEILPIMANVPQYSTAYWIYVIGIAIVSALPSVIVYY